MIPAGHSIYFRESFPPSQIGHFPLRIQTLTPPRDRDFIVGLGSYTRDSIFVAWPLRPLPERLVNITRPRRRCKIGVTPRASAPVRGGSAPLELHRADSLLAAADDRPAAGQEVGIGQDGVRIGDLLVVEVGAPLVDRATGSRNAEGPAALPMIIGPWLPQPSTASRSVSNSMPVKSPSAN